jgi:hypothetical protein
MASHPRWVYYYTADGTTVLSTAVAGGPLTPN